MATLTASNYSFHYVIRTEIPWRFFRITYSANTNVTNTADIWVC